MLALYVLPQLLAHRLARTFKNTKAFFLYLTGFTAKKQL
jgi:hypothetical protein